VGNQFGWDRCASWGDAEGWTCGNKTQGDRVHEHKKYTNLVPSLSRVFSVNNESSRERYAVFARFFFDAQVEAFEVAMLARGSIEREI
jgi:hypothetical protein